MKGNLRDFWRAYEASRSKDGDELVSIADKNLGPLDHLRVLDLGCGNGAVSVAFAKRGAAVTAVDISAGRITNTIARARQEGISLSTALVADGCRLPFQMKRFDFVVLLDLIEHVSNPKRLLSEAARVLRPCGRIYVTVPSRYSLINLVSDPHYDALGVSLLPHRWAEWYVTKLLRIQPTYTVERYFSFAEIVHLFYEAGLHAWHLEERWAQKIGSGARPKNPNRMWMYRLSQVRWIKSLLLKGVNTRMFRNFIQGGWVFMCWLEPIPSSRIIPK